MSLTARPVQALAALGIRPQAVRAAIEASVGPGQRPPVGLLPFSPHARTVVELAGQQVRQLRGEHVGVEHLLLALIHQRTGVAATALAQVGAGYDAVRVQLVRVLADSPPTSPDDLPPPPR